MTAAITSAYEAARRRAAWIDRSDRGRILLAGADRASFLQGLLTNDVAALKRGQGCYAAYLTPQGRMIADMHVYELGDRILLTAAGELKEPLLQRLDQSLFSEDVQLRDVTGAYAQVAIVGPEAVSLVGRVATGIESDVLTALPEHGNVSARFEGETAIVTRTGDAGEPGFDLFVDRAKMERLVAAAAAAGAVPLDAADAEAIRIEAGIPLFHRDMDEQTIPLEAGLETRAISFSKGCYVGQEVVIRVLHRGHGRVARKLAGLVLEGGAAPAAGTPVRAADREVGHVTSAAMSPALGRPIALAYLHSDFLAPGTAVTVAGVSGEVRELPFIRRGDARGPG
jgi:folate-binding protein YgfZ